MHTCFSTNHLIPLLTLSIIVLHTWFIASRMMREPCSRLQDICNHSHGILPAGPRFQSSSTGGRGSYHHKSWIQVFRCNFCFVYKKQITCPFVARVSNIYSGKSTVCYGKPPAILNKNESFLVHFFSIALLVYWRCKTMNHPSRISSNTLW